MPRVEDGKEIKTIDDHLRSKARQELKHEIHNAFEQVRKFFRTGYATDVVVNNKEISTHLVIDALENKAFELHQGEREDKAVKDFLKDVESFRQQLNDLQPVEF